MGIKFLLKRDAVLKHLAKTSSQQKYEISYTLVLNIVTDFLQL